MGSRTMGWVRFAAVAALATVLGLASAAKASTSRDVPASGEVITVTTLDDVSDFTDSKKVIDLPGSDGLVSFREAITAANNTTGPQTIAFAIPPTSFWLLPDVGLLRLEQSALSLDDSGTTIDFSTQTSNMGNTNSSGPEIGIYGLDPGGYGSPAIFVNGNNCVIKGLGKVYQRGYALRIVGDHNRVIGCEIEGPSHAAISISGLGGASPLGNIVGGTAAEEGNTLVGLWIDGPAEGNIVIGNDLLVDVEVRGAPQFGAIARSNRIGGPSRAERNVISGAGYYGEEGFPVGAQVSVIDADGTVIEGNYVGTTADGMRASSQIGPVGVEVRDSRDTTIRGNVIAGMRVQGRNHAAGMTFGQAVFLNAVNADTRSTLIEDNTIGLATDGVTAIPTYSGISVAPARSVDHVFDTRIVSNHIARVDATGVLVSSLENGVTITGNSIHDCGGLGIDLGAANKADGPTPNDAGDGDSGGNLLQNFPVLSSVLTTGSSVLIQGFLDSSRSAQFRIEFFSSPSCDASGFGEGRTFIGSTSATTDGSGLAAFAVTLERSVALGATITSTATRLTSGDTSEFSACRVATQARPPLANALATPRSGVAPLTVSFDSSASSDPDGSIASYSWNFGDGSSSTLANPSHSYNSAGTFVATLTVTNKSNMSATDKVTIAATTRVLSTAIELSGATQGNEVSVTGNVVVRSAAGAAVTDLAVSVTWEKPDGITATLISTTNAAGLATFNAAGRPGTYTLVVTDVVGAGFTFDPTVSVQRKSINVAASRRRSVRGS